jgi:hypothetical protein
MSQGILQGKRKYSTLFKSSWARGSISRRYHLLLGRIHIQQERMFLLSLMARESLCQLEDLILLGDRISLFVLFRPSTDFVRSVLQKLPHRHT